MRDFYSNPISLVTLRAAVSNLNVFYQTFSSGLSGRARELLVAQVRNLISIS